MQPPRDRELGVVDGQRAVGVVEEELDLAEARRRRAVAAPAKRTSSGFSARSSSGLSEPAAQRIASETFDLPEPFGPTMTPTPGSRRTSTGSGNDLKPRMLDGAEMHRSGRNQGHDGATRRRLRRFAGERGVLVPLEARDAAPLGLLGVSSSRSSGACRSLLAGHAVRMPEPGALRGPPPARPLSSTCLDPRRAARRRRARRR